MQIIKLQPAKQATIIQGHPWVFPKAIANDTSSIKTGELVKVVSAQNEAIGVGVFNEHSLYRVRMLAYASEPVNLEDLAAIIEYRLRQAHYLRQQLSLPNSTTNAYRLFNSEGDGLSGLTIDIYETVIVISSSAFWVEAHRELIEAKIIGLFNSAKIIWFSQAKPLAQDGWQQAAEKNAESLPQIEVAENGIRYFIDFNHVQKTGLFLDQRDNHRLIASLASGKRVLDLYCFTGGFALAAASANAKSVTAIDSSEPAILQAKHNANLNGFSGINFQKADARENLHLASEHELIILDPPKVVPSRKHLAKGEKYYQHLHSEIFQAMQRGSLLLTCNCSAAMTKENFLKLIQYCANKVNRRVRILGTYGAGSDHPMLCHFPEGNYLHAILLSVQ